MASPFYHLIPGNFVIVGKEPDGDSVRFVANDLDLYKVLHRSYLIKPARDRSVQLRFEGVDAPELHYGSAEQPLGAEVRDRLLDWMGFTNIQYKSSTSTKVQSAQPDSVPGAILSKASDAHGRPISYVLLEAEAQPLIKQDWVRVDKALVKKTLNFRLLNEGLAYYLAYTSLPLEHRQQLSKVARAAREASRGVWKLDTTEDFVLENQDSIGVNGQLIYPKLFRRCTDYLKAVADGFSGNLTDWLVSTGSGKSRNENDRVVINDSVEVNFSSLLLQHNRHIVFQGDLLELTFVEK